MTCEDVRMSLGVYVLGALDAEEAAEVEAHLDGCPECAAELMELSGLPAMLARVSEEDITHAAAPPRAMLDRLVVVSARRSRWSRIMLGLAASLVVAALGGSAWLVSARGGVATSAPASTSDTAQAAAGSPAPPTANQSTKALDAPADAPAEAQAGGLEREGSNGGVRLSVRLVSESGGTRVVSWVRGVPAGTVCRLWAVGKDGTRSPAGSWEVPKGGYRGAYEASTELPLSQIQSLVLSTSDGRGLVTVPV
ncbi:hypothetical protein Pth03_59060 [Planotetraspora thailandica]|uniref:Putative zinc-finger domain-containing protein n=1 Tax=Planotetraspora thailandica TaxID=487172 RepID=A0A8J3XWE2_9ACTN|nr:zf-HC2 domain-containing protein [Planotetraspora thailandica]GII57517.1 hypothetical protein Pth03_59060 [Planotetraspora thailandica]